MCGIIGAIGKNIDLDIIVDLFLATEPRGKEATGFWTSATDTIKAAKGASKFLDRKTKKKLKKGISESDILLGHCRYATHGKPEYNYNQHPMESENWIVVHNGVVSIKDFDDYEYVSDTDTENIVAYIERFGLEGGLAKIASGASIILKNKSEDDCIYVWRTSTGDMLLALDVDNQTLYVCSGEKYMKEGVATKYFDPDGYDKLFCQLDRTILLGEPKSRELWKITMTDEGVKANMIKTIPVDSVVGGKMLNWRDGQEVAKLTANVGRGKLRPGVLEGRVKPFVKPVTPPCMSGNPGVTSQKSIVKGGQGYYTGDIISLSRDIGPTDAIFCTSGDMVEDMQAGMQFKIRKVLRNDRFAIENKGSTKVYVVEKDMVNIVEQPSCMGVMMGATPDICDDCFFFDTCENLFRMYNYDNEDKPDCVGSFEADDEDCMNCEYLAYCLHQTWGTPVTEIVDVEAEEVTHE